MDDFRVQLEHRRSTLRALARPSPVLERLLAQGRILRTPAGPWSVAERRLVALLSRTLRFRRAQCYANAQQAVLLAQRIGAEAAGHALEYWEGFAHLPLPAPFAHAWCVLNGRVWDPSLDHLGLPVTYLGTPIPTPFVLHALSDRRTHAPLLPRWHSRPDGDGAARVEQTRRAGAAPTRRGLAGPRPWM